MIDVVLRYLQGGGGGGGVHFYWQLYHVRVQKKNVFRGGRGTRKGCQNHGNLGEKGIGVRDQFRLGGLRPVARIFSPLLARKSSGFARILPDFFARIWLF